MRIVVQRVAKASVEVGGEVISSIGRGICVLVGLERTDTTQDSEWMIKKMLNLKIFEDDKGKMWSKNVVDKEYEVLLVSQFTLYHGIVKAGSKNNRSKPDFHQSMGSSDAREFYSKFVDDVKKSYKADMVKEGQFGAMMQVSIVNDGPVTMQIDSRNFVYTEEYTKSDPSASAKASVDNMKGSVKDLKDQLKKMKGKLEDCNKVIADGDGDKE